MEPPANPGRFILCLGAVAFPLAAWVALRLVAKHAPGALFHLRNAALLYGYIITATATIIVAPPPNGLEGSDVALRASILVAAYGIVVNAVVGWAAGRELPSTDEGAI